jgi:lipopolysaccharide export system protein LptA
VALVGADGKDVTTTATEPVVAKAPSTVTVRSAKVTANRRLKVSIELPSALSPSEAAGRVVVRRGGKVIGRARTIAGAATVKLELGRKFRSAKLTVTYRGNDVVAPSSARARVRVIKG